MVDTSLGHPWTVRDPPMMLANNVEITIHMHVYRLGRLTVNINPSGISVETSNIGAFSFHPVSLPKDVQGAPFLFDGQVIKLDEATWGQPNVVIAFVREEDGVWKVSVWFRVGAVAVVLLNSGAYVSAACLVRCFDGTAHRKDLKRAELNRPHHYRCP